VVADFSQKNSQVELAAPGVGVLSTVPFIETNTLSILAARPSAAPHRRSGRTNGATARSPRWALHLRRLLVGQGRALRTRRCQLQGQSRQRARGRRVAAVIYNNVSGGFLGTCDDGTGTTCALPAISLSQADGQARARHLGKTAR
jgi:serine protease